MVDEIIAKEVRVKLQYKKYKGYFYYDVCCAGIERFTSIEHKMFCFDCITKSDCELEIDYDVDEFSCILRDDDGKEYELVDYFSNFNLYVVESKIISEKVVEEENSCIKYYDFKECNGVRIKVTLQFLNYKGHYFINVGNEKGTAAFNYADVFRYSVCKKDCIESDCCFKVYPKKFSCKLKDNNDNILEMNLNFDKLYDYIVKIETVEVI